MLTVKPLRYINTLWLGVYVRYTPWNMLDIPQQNPLKYGFSGIEIYIYIYIYICIYNCIFQYKCQFDPTHVMIVSTGNKYS